MHAYLRRQLTLSLILVAGSCAALFPVLHTSTAWADDGGDDDDDSAASGDDDSAGDGGGDEEPEEDADQPPITAGGLYTLSTYPQGEIQRPLTMTMGITELRAGIGFDISNKNAFKTFGLSLDGRYGLQDHVELQGGFKGINNFKDITAYAAFEGAIIYDVVDFRAGLQLDTAQPPVVAPATEAKRETNFGVTVGFPFRYAPKPQVAVVALETLFEIQFDSKPDATPNIGIIVQPVPILAVIVKAAVRVKDFDFSSTKLTIPATVAVQLSPTNKLDAGLEFTFPNLKPADSATKFYDQRAVLFFGQLRL